MALPCHTQAVCAQRQFEIAGLGPGSYDDAVLSAHEALGLVTEVGPSNDRHATPALHIQKAIQLGRCMPQTCAIEQVATDPTVQGRYALWLQWGQLLYKRMSNAI